MVEPYTIVAVEVVDMEGTKRSYRHEVNRWDMDCYEMGEMFANLLLAMGFHPENVNDLFCDDCVDRVENDTLQ
jgi:hypothetical protein